MERWIVDGGLAVIFLVTVLTYWRRGFTKTVLGAISLIGALVLALVFADTVGAWLNAQFLEKAVVESISTALNEHWEAGITPQELIDSLPGSFRQLIDLIGLDVSSIVKGADISQGLSALAEPIGKEIAVSVSFGLGFTVAFIVAYICTEIVTSLVGKIVKLPVLHTMDSLLGLALGLIIGFGLTFLGAHLFHVIMVMLSAKNTAVTPYLMPEGSILYRWLLSLHL